MFHLLLAYLSYPLITPVFRILKVNPIAVNSKYCNVFTENKRAVSIISTEHFGKVGCFNNLKSGCSFCFLEINF